MDEVDHEAEQQEQEGTSRGSGLEQIREDSQENAESTHHPSQALGNFSARPKEHVAVTTTPLKAGRNQQAPAPLREPSGKRGRDQERPIERQQ